MQLNLDWNKEFQEFQDILNCGIHLNGFIVLRQIWFLNQLIPVKASNFSVHKIL